jgi:DNA invertase Pin-like site-specific DNA recombinase
MLSQRTRDALAAAKANGKRLGSLHAHGREAKAAAIERARALAPLFDGWRISQPARSRVS